LWVAQILSVAGDQLARVAITLLVFSQTHSALLASVAFAASVVPSFVGGLVLSGLADRWPRQQVMIACDLGRAALVTIMAVPGLPLPVRVGPLFIVTLISAPFTSARAAVYPDILSGDRYVLGTAVTLTTLQFSQVVGFAVGGVIAGFFGISTSLLADAATFLGSALITRLWVRARPTAQPAAHPGTRARSAAMAGIRLVFGDPRLRTPMLLGWLAAFYNIPAGVAAPLGHALGGGDIVVGLILAASALGASLGAVLFSRLVGPARRLRWMSPAAAASCAVLLLFGFRPALPATLVILAVCGLFDCYQLAASAAFVSAAPASHRSQAFGIAQGGLSLGQGGAMIVAGALAQYYPPAEVIAVGGLLGMVATLLITVSSHGTQPG
jgi:MFS family permease